jgi:hypothetical protein
MFAAVTGNIQLAPLGVDVAAVTGNIQRGPGRSPGSRRMLPP